MSNTIATPPWKGVGKRIESAIRRAAYEHKMFDEATKVGIALSGGKDSLTLLYMLKALSGRGFPPFEIIALHVTGEFSCGAGVNLPYLTKVCEELDVKLVVLESTQKRETLECYSCSRERRRLIFDAAEAEGVETIAFGHHRDDSAQTLLMNMFQKGEFAANLPKLKMYRFGITILRPLIYVSEEMVRTFAEQEGFIRIMCKCPVGQNSMRKKVDRLLEEITELFPNARENVARAGLIYGSDKAAKP